MGKELGIAAEVENVAVAVDVGDGNVGIARPQRIAVQGSDTTTVSTAKACMHCHACTYMRCLISRIIGLPCIRHVHKHAKCHIIITPRACAQGVKCPSVVVVGTKIARSRDVGI